MKGAGDSALHWIHPRRSGVESQDRLGGRSDLTNTPFVTCLSASTVENHLAVFNRLDCIKMQVMVFTACGGIGLRQLDALSFNMVDRADMLLVGTGHFHVFLNL